MTFHSGSIGALLGALLSAQAAHAAQEVRVLSGGADIRSEPVFDAQVIEHHEPGDILSVSNKNRDKWHKVTLKGKTGWVHESQFVQTERFSAMSRAGVQYTDQPERTRTRHLYVLHAHFSRAYTNPVGLQSQLDATQGLVTGYSYGAELGFRLNTRLTLAARGTLTSFSGSDGEDIAYSGSSTDISLLADYSVVHRLPIKFNFAIGPGYTISASMKGSVAGKETEASSFGGFTTTGKVTLCWYATQNLAFALESGYRYFHPTNVDFGGKSVETDLSLFFAGGGITIEF